jgi:putative ABC transport system permease protein
MSGRDIHETGQELEFHLEMLTRRYVEDGLSPDAARAKALARMGDVAAAERESRAILTSMETHMSRPPVMQSIVQDVRYAVRVLRRSPVFTLTALLTLAVGIGATTAIFSVVNAVLLRDLPYPNADRLMVVFNSYQQAGLEAAAVSPEEFADLRTQLQAFEDMAAIRPQVSALTDDCLSGDCEPARINAYAVSPKLFALLGVRPRIGRPFSSADGITGAPRVVMLSDVLWQHRYGGDESIVGRTITLGGIPREVIGVMPPGVRFPDERVGYLKDKADLWIPVGWEQLRDGRGNQYLEVLALRRPNVAADQVDADLQRVGDAFKSQFPSRYAEPAVRWRLGTRTLTEAMVGDVRMGLIVLFGAVGCVLFIACANVTNLMLARGAARRRELAVRSALGAGRRRLVQQLLIETLVVTTGGTLLGLVVAAGGLELLLALDPGGIPRIDLARIDASVLLFAVGLALATGVIVGLLPALRQARTTPQAALGDGARGTDTASPRRRMRGLLVVAEVALAVVVLTAATLLIRSYAAIVGTPVGLRAENVAVARVSIARAQYNEPAKVFAFHRSIRDRLAAIPGVTSASAVYPLPMSGDGWSGTVGIVGHPDTPGVPSPHAEFAVSLPGYFATVGIPIIEGRDFTDRDDASIPHSVVVDAAFAQTYFPGRSPVGERIAVNGNTAEGPFQTIIGVVGHVRNQGAREGGEGQIYLSALQKQEFSLYFVAGTTVDPSTVLPAVRSAVRAENARLPLAALTTLEDVLASFTARDRFNTLLFAIFGAVALVIAAIGLYGVLAFLVTQRTREIGIRLALGGTPAELVRSVLFEGLALTGIGVIAGLGGAYLLGRAMRDLLFGIAPSDPAAYLTIVAVMLIVAVLAAAGPARRATRVDPVDVLRG